MEQRDYIKRQIEQIGILLGRMLSTLLGLRSGGDTGSAIQQICGELKDELDTPALPSSRYAENLRTN